MNHRGLEKRKHPRISGSFIVPYRIPEEADKVDISQIKNLSLDGMLFTTNRQFPPNTKLALEIRLPFVPHPIILIAKAIESRKIVEDLIYDTRLEFLDVDEIHKKVISQTVEYYLKKG